jgi:hypothetical protein
MRSFMLVWVRMVELISACIGLWIVQLVSFETFF